MTTQHPAASANLDLDDLKKTAKDALRYLSHIELHLEKSEAPKTILNRAVDVRLCIKELRDALARRATHQNSEADERALFEQWFVAALRKTYLHMPESGVQRMLSRHEDGTYIDLTTQHDWSVWQASVVRAALTRRATTTTVDCPECGFGLEHDPSCARATTAEQQAVPESEAEVVRALLSSIPQAVRLDMIQGAATTSSASIGDDRAFRQRLHSSRMAISDVEQHGADAELVAYIDSRATAPSREAAATGTAIRNKLFPGPSIGEVLEQKDREIADLRIALAQQSASPGSRAIDFNKLAVLMTHYLAGNVPDDLYWRVDVTAEVLRRAVAVVRDAAQVQQSAAPGGADFETWWNTPNPKTGQPPSEVIDRNSARYAWEAAQAQAGGSDARDGLHATIEFRLFDRELPALTEHSDSYGGTWNSDWCVVVDNNGYVSTDRFKASESEKVSIENGHREFARWMPPGSWGNYRAWAYRSEVKTAIDAAMSAAGQEGGK